MFLWYPSLWGQNQDNWDPPDPTSAWLLPLTPVPWFRTNPYTTRCEKHSCPQRSSCCNREGLLLSAGQLPWLLQPEAPLPAAGCWKLLEGSARRWGRSRAHCPVEEGPGLAGSGKAKSSPGSWGRLLSSFLFISSGTPLLYPLGPPVRTSVPIKYNLWDSKPRGCLWWRRARRRQRAAWWHGAWSPGHAWVEPAQSAPSLGTDNLQVV